MKKNDATGSVQPRGRLLPIAMIVLQLLALVPPLYLSCLVVIGPALGVEGSELPPLLGTGIVALPILEIIVFALGWHLYRTGQTRVALFVSAAPAVMIGLLSWRIFIGF